LQLFFLAEDTKMHCVADVIQGMCMWLFQCHPVHSSVDVADNQWNVSSGFSFSCSRKLQTCA